MNAVSQPLDARARKNLTTILQGLASVGLSPIATALGRDESTVSRMKERELPVLAALLSASGLKVVPVDYRCFDARKVDALLTFADAYLDRIRHAEQLAEDDE